MAELAADRSVVRDPISMAELREDYRYMANVCMSLLPDLEPALGRYVAIQVALDNRLDGGVPPRIPAPR